PDLGMPCHLLLSLLGQWPRFQEHHVIRPDLPDVAHARRVANQLDLRVLQPHPPRESLREPRNTLRVTVGVGIAEVDEIGQLQDRALGLFSHVRAVANREQDYRHGHTEKDERPRLRLRRDRGERAEYEQRHLVRHQPAVKGPPTADGIAPDLERDDEVDESAVHEILRDCRDPDRPRLARDLRAGAGDEEERRRSAGDCLGTRRARGGARAPFRGPRGCRREEASEDATRGYSPMSVYFTWVVTLDLP